MKKGILCAAAAVLTSVAATNAQAYVLYGVEVDDNPASCAANKLSLTQQQCEHLLTTAKKRYEQITAIGVSESQCKKDFTDCVAAPLGGFRPKFEKARLNLDAKYSGPIAKFLMYKPQPDLDGIEKDGGFPLVKRANDGILVYPVLRK